MKSIKTVILGYSSTGKSSIADRIIKNNFSENIGSTIGASFTVYKQQNFNLQIWDTAGQERYLSLVPIYYRAARLLMLVYDNSNVGTIDSLKYYLDKIIKDLDDNFEIIFIGNKTDLVSPDDVKICTKKLKELIMPYESISVRYYNINVSAKTGANFAELRLILHEMGNKIIKNNDESSYDYTNHIPNESQSMTIQYLNKCNCMI